MYLLVLKTSFRKCCLLTFIGEIEMEGKLKKEQNCHYSLLPENRIIVLALLIYV